MSQIERQFADDHGPDYFRSLLAIRSALQTEANAHFDIHHLNYPRLWTTRKVLWKILMTPYSSAENAVEIRA